LQKNRLIISDWTDQGDNNEPAVGGISGTMMDSLKVFFKTGQRIMNAQLQRINSDAERNVEEWKQAPSNGRSYRLCYAIFISSDLIRVYT